MLGYRVTVCDARAVFATVQRFPMADEVVNDWPDRYLAKVGDELGPRDAVCVLTHDHKFDVPAIAAAVKTEVGYLGAMGRGARTRVASSGSREAGLTEAEIARVMSPIGLDVGARTPEETADRDLRRDHRARAPGAAARRCATLRVPFTDAWRRRPRVDLGIAGTAGRGRGRVEGPRVRGRARRSRAEGVQRRDLRPRSRETIDAAAAEIGHDAVPIVADVVDVDGAGRLRPRRRAPRWAASTSSLPTRAARRRATSRTRPSTSTSTRSSSTATATIAMCYEAVPEMRDAEWGRVVAITSIAVRQPIPNLILSNTARAGLTGFLKTLAREVAADGVTVNSLLPGTARDRAHRRRCTAAGGDLAAGVPAGRDRRPRRLRSRSARSSARNTPGT